MVTDYIRLLSRTCSRIEDGQWVCCLVGQYHGDVGYVSDMDKWNASMVFMPRIPIPRGKQQWGGWLPPWAWTATEVVQQFDHRKVHVHGTNKFTFGGSLYDDGLIWECIPISHLCVSNHSLEDITPFVWLNKLRTEPLFNACVKCFAQDLTQVGDRILVVSGEHAGIISCIQRIHDNVMDIVTQSPEEHSELVIGVVLHGLMPYFLDGDHVKDHWSNHAGTMLAINNNNKKVTFLRKEINEKVRLSHHPLPLLMILGSVDCYIYPQHATLQSFSLFFPIYSRSFCRLSWNSWCNLPEAHIAGIRWQCQNYG